MALEAGLVYDGGSLEYENNTLIWEGIAATVPGQFGGTLIWDRLSLVWDGNTLIWNEEIVPPDRIGNVLAVKTSRARVLKVKSSRFRRRVDD